MGTNNGSFSSGPVLSAGSGEGQAQSCACVEDMCPVGGEIKLLSRRQEALAGCLKSSAERPLMSISAYSGHLSSWSKLPTQLSRDKGRDAASIQKQPQEGT